MAIPTKAELIQALAHFAAGIDVMRSPIDDAFAEQAAELENLLQHVSDAGHVVPTQEPAHPAAAQMCRSFADWALNVAGKCTPDMAACLRASSAQLTAWVMSYEPLATVDMVEYRFVE